ncbi:MAG TPA: hypothetical protein VFY41_06460 [Nitrososphaeraceae archaeon]|nr:hypothetical protein [Nitrososphaeraceae archaeon]
MVNFNNNAISKGQMTNTWILEISLKGGQCDYSSFDPATAVKDRKKLLK